MAGPSGLTTEAFIDKVAWRLGRYVAAEEEQVEPEDLVIPDPKFRRNYNVDSTAVKEMFEQFDTDKSGTITLNEFEALLAKIGVAPLKDPMKRSSASTDKIKEGPI